MRSSPDSSSQLLTQDKLEKNSHVYNYSSKYDAIISNAVAQWHNYSEMLNLLDSVEERGFLAIQMPDDKSLELQNLLILAAKNAGCDEEIHNVYFPKLDHNPSQVYDMLKPKSSFVDIWKTDYSHILDKENFPPHPVMSYAIDVGLNSILDILLDHDTSMSTNYDYETIFPYLKTEKYLEELEILLNERYPVLCTHNSESNACDINGNLKRQTVTYDDNRIFIVAQKAPLY